MSLQKKPRKRSWTPTLGSYFGQLRGCASALLPCNPRRCLWQIRERRCAVRIQPIYQRQWKTPLRNYGGIASGGSEYSVRRVSIVGWTTSLHDPNERAVLPTVKLATSLPLTTLISESCQPKWPYVCAQQGSMPVPKSRSTSGVTWLPTRKCKRSKLAR